MLAVSPVVWSPAMHRHHDHQETEHAGSRRERACVPPVHRTRPAHTHRTRKPLTQPECSQPLPTLLFPDAAFAVAVRVAALLQVLLGVAAD